MIKVLMICHGNICRSPMAEFILKDMVKKRNGEFVPYCFLCNEQEEIGNSLHPGARAKLDEMGIPHKSVRQYSLPKKIILPMIICCVWISGISIM